MAVEDSHHVLKKLLNDQLELCKWHTRLKNPIIITSLRLSLLNLSSLVHALGLDDNSIHNDKDSLFSNSHEYIYLGNLSQYFPSLSSFPYFKLGI